MNRNLILTALVIMPVLLPAQSASKLPEFDIADIRPSDPSVMKMGKGRMLPGGGLKCPGTR